MPVILVIFTVSHTSYVKCPQRRVTESLLQGQARCHPLPQLSLSLPSAPSPHPEGNTGLLLSQPLGASLPPPGPPLSCPAALAADEWHPPSPARRVWSPCLRLRQGLEPGRAWQAASASLVGCPGPPSGPLYSGSCNLDRLPYPNCYLWQQSLFPGALPTPR